MKKRRFRIHFNIGTVIFSIIFLYLIITLLLYAFRTHVETYQVMSGPLSGNDTYTALILRNESVVKSSVNGYVNYFLNDSSKVAKSDIVCSVTSEQQPSANVSVGSSEFEQMRTLAANTSRQFDSNSFDEVYDLQYSLYNIMWETAADSASGNFYTASEDGIVSTLTDGFEYVTEATLTADLGQNSNYSSNRLSNQDKVNIGDNLYRIVNNEEWYIYFTLTDEQLIRLASLSDIKVKFLKDNNTETGKLTFIEVEGQRYGKITLDSGLIRYVDDRFAEVEIVSNTQTGLKIPVSSVVTKEFYLIPELFLTYSGDNGSDAGFLKEVRNEDGTKTTEFVETTVYELSEAEDEESEGMYYVDTGSFEVGDVLVATNSDSKFTVGRVGTLEGVYSVNRGYAVFRKINIIDQNSEYCIVEEGTSYGLSMYDYIVLDGSTVAEDQIVQY